MAPPIQPRRPSRWWLALGTACAVLTLAAVLGALLFQRHASQPIGEGEVFLDDAAMAAEIITSGEGRHRAVRLARNALMVEAVSVVDRDGFVAASTSPTFHGLALSNPMLAFGASAARVVAVADEIEEPLTIDGIVEWEAGEILYQLVSPLDTGESILIHYDVAELLGRRAQPGELQPETIELFVLALVFALLGTAVLVGHNRAEHRYREVARESELLRDHSAKLEETNRALDEARREAERALALAEEKIRIRSEFVLMINHELRTPLTAVVTGANLLRNSGLSEQERDEVLKAMVADGERLQEIIDQILAVARIENQGLSYVLSEVEPDEVWRAVVDAHPAAHPGAMNHPHGTRLVRTDPRTLALVVASLVDNALTHGATAVVVGCSPGAPVQPLLEVGERPDEALFITVSDNGPGIDPVFLPRVFEKFEKTGFSSGTGLGLYMARLIVEALGGSLGVNTSPAGSVFTIALPLIPAPARVEAAL